MCSYFGCLEFLLNSQIQDKSKIENGRFLLMNDDSSYLHGCYKTQNNKLIDIANRGIPHLGLKTDADYSESEQDPYPN